MNAIAFRILTCWRSCCGQDKD